MQSRAVAGQGSKRPPIGGSPWRERPDADVIRTGSFASVGELVRDIETYLDDRNANPKPYKWKAKGEAILEKIRRARAALDKTKAA